MKVIKIVGEGAERRTYVDGGPVCEHRGHDFNNKACPRADDCKNCDGLFPVKLWTDAEKIEQLLESSRRESASNRGRIDIRKRKVQRDKKKVWRYFIETWPRFTYPEPEGETSSAALTAAVIAVAEEEK